jgi:hypothetical protein
MESEGQGVSGSNSQAVVQEEVTLNSSSQEIQLEEE